MAEIPVEKKSSMTWLWVLLALILAALLLWWLLDDDDEAYVEPVAVEATQADGTIITNGVATNQATAAAGAVTDLSVLMPAISQDMVGREFQLNNVQVQEVVGDIGFWVGPNSDQRVFAVLTQEQTPGTAMEGEADVNSGATANISGTIRTRGELLENFAQGRVNDLPQGVDRFLVVENYEVTQAGQNQ